MIQSIDEWRKQPAGYVIQNACATCSHCFVKTDYDQGPEFFCTFGAPPRPRCCSASMEEAAGDDSLPADTSAWSVEDWRKHTEEKCHPAQDAWHAWAHGRKVAPHGICPKFEVLEA